MPVSWVPPQAGMREREVEACSSERERGERQGQRTAELLEHKSSGMNEHTGLPVPAGEKRKEGECAR